MAFSHTAAWRVVAVCALTLAAGCQCSGTSSGVAAGSDLAAGGAPDKTGAGAAARPIDLSTPRAASLTYGRAWVNGDAAALAAAIYAPDEGTRQLAEALGAWAAAAREVREAAAKAYGREAGATVLEGHPLPDPASLGRKVLKDSRWWTFRVRGDDATLLGGRAPSKLKRIDGQWKMVMPLTDLRKEHDPKKLVMQSPEMAALAIDVLAGRIEQKAHEIAAGKYPSPASAMAALERIKTADDDEEETEVRSVEGTTEPDGGDLQN